MDLFYYRNSTGDLSSINTHYIVNMSVKLHRSNLCIQLIGVDRVAMHVPISDLHSMSGCSWFSPFLQECRKLSKEHNIALPSWMRPCDF